MLPTIRSRFVGFALPSFFFSAPILQTSGDCGLCNRVSRAACFRRVGQFVNGDPIACVLSTTCT